MTPIDPGLAQVLPIILPLIWAAILALAVFLYVLLGGYDLGLGVLFPLAPSDKDRDAMMNSVAPFWDGNETWLVLGGGGLLAAFPLAYSVMLPALYIPITLDADGPYPARRRLRVSLQVRSLPLGMGSCLCRRIDPCRFDAGRDHRRLHRGLHRRRTTSSRASRSIGSRRSRPSPRLPFSPGYVMLSAGWLIMKGDEALREWAYGVGRYALIALTAFIVIFSLVDAVPASRDRCALVQAGAYRDAEPGAACHCGDGDRDLGGRSRSASAICPSS
jgi:cytochrome d ubiquinol oxidase subunit II